MGARYSQISNEFLTFELPVRFKWSTQIRDTSSSCQQLWKPHPLCSHSSSAHSLPRQSTSSIQILPVAVPKGLFLKFTPCILIHKTLQLKRVLLTSDIIPLSSVPSCLWLITARCYASAVYAVMQCLSVRLSVCPSVTFVDHVKTNKHILEVFTPSGSDTILVFSYQRRCRYSDGNPLTGGVECKGGMKNADFFHKYLAVSQNGYS